MGLLSQITVPRAAHARGPGHTHGTASLETRPAKALRLTRCGARLGTYAKEVGCRVVFPLYRLAPKHPFPTFFEDCYSAFAWTYDHAGELGIDVEHIGIGGDSAGSTLAVGVCLMARQRITL